MTVEQEACRRLSLMQPGLAYVIFDAALGTSLCAGGWATRDRLGYYRITAAGFVAAASGGAP